MAHCFVLFLIALLFRVQISFLRLYIAKYNIIVAFLSSNEFEDLLKPFLWISFLSLHWIMNYENWASRSSLSAMWTMIILAQDKFTVILFSRIWGESLKSWKCFTERYRCVDLKATALSQRNQHAVCCTTVVLLQRVPTSPPLVSNDFSGLPVGKLWDGVGNYNLK